MRRGRNFVQSSLGFGQKQLRNAQCFFVFVQDSTNNGHCSFNKGQSSLNNAQCSTNNRHSSFAFLPDFGAFM
jgi:hypothetical protein